MGFANGWKIIELADANVKQRNKKGDKKGKGRAGESVEERTVNDRSRALLFNVSELGDGFEKILKRVKAEQGNKEIVFKIILDVNSLVYNSYCEGRRIIQRRKELTSDERRLCFERLQAWLTYTVCEEYKLAIPEGCQVEIEAHVDHRENRGEKKEFELEERYLKDAVNVAEKSIEELLDLRAKKKRETKSRKRRDRKKKQELLKKLGQEARTGTDQDYEVEDNLDDDGDVEMKDAGQTEEQVAEKVSKVVRKKAEDDPKISVPFEFPAESATEHADPIVKMLATEILKDTTLVTASAEADDSIVARSQKPNTFQDRRISSVVNPTRLDRMELDDDAPEDVPHPSPSFSPSTTTSKSLFVSISIVVSTDCDFVYQLQPSDVRFVIGPYKSRTENRFRVVDLLALHEAESWPFKNMEASCGAAVMVSKEKGPKVEKLGILSLVKNETLVEFLNDLYKIVDFVEEQQRIQGMSDQTDDASDDEEEEEEEEEGTSFESLEGSFLNLEDLNSGIKELYRRAGFEAGPPGTIEEFVGFVTSMLHQPEEDSISISKKGVITKMAEKLVLQALKDHETAEINKRQNSRAGKSRVAVPKRGCRRKRSNENDEIQNHTLTPSTEQHSPQILPRESHSRPPTPGPSNEPRHIPPSSESNGPAPPHPEPESTPHSRRRTKKLNLFKCRAYNEAFDLKKEIDRDIKAQKEIDRKNKTTAPLNPPRQRQPPEKKQKFSRAEGEVEEGTRAKTEKEGPEGVGIKLEGFDLRCISEIPLSAKSFNELIFYTNATNDLADDDERFKAFASAREWSQGCLWIFKSMLTVGRFSNYQMGQLLDVVMRSTAVHEPGYLHYFTEAPNGVVLIGETLLRVLKDLQVDDKTLSTETPATDDAIDNFFKAYDNENKLARRYLYSSEGERELTKQAIRNFKISKEELDKFAKVCESNRMPCIGMLLVAKAVKSNDSEFAPLVQLAHFYSLNLPVLGVNVVVASRKYAQNWSKTAADFIITNALDLTDCLSRLPFAYDIGFLGTLPNRRTLSRAATVVLEGLAADAGKESELSSSVHSAIVKALKSVGTLSNSPSLDPTHLRHDLTAALNTREAGFSRLFNMKKDWKPANAKDMEEGVDDAIKRLVEVTTIVGKLAQRGIVAVVDHIEAVDNADEEKAKEEALKKKGKAGGQGDGEEQGDGKEQENSKKESKKQRKPRQKKRRSSQLRDLKTIGEWEEITIEVKKGVQQKKTENREEGELEGTVDGGVGAKEFRTFTRQWDSAFGRPSIRWDTQGTRLDTELIIHFVRPKVGKDNNDYENKRPLAFYLSTHLKRQARAIEYLNKIKFHKTEQPGGGGPGEELSKGARRAADSAERFVKGSSRLNHPKKKLQPKLTGLENLRPQGLRFLDFSQRYDLLRPQQYDEGVLLAGVHDSGIIRFTGGGPIPEFEVFENLVDSFSRACEDLFKLFDVPYKDIDGTKNVTRLIRHVKENAHDHLQALFKVNVGSRILYDQIYLKDGQIQLSCQDFRRASPKGIALFDKFGIDPSLSWTRSIPRLLSEKKYNYTGSDADKRNKLKDKPDLTSATSASDWSSILIRRPYRPNSFSSQRRIKNGGPGPSIYKDKNGKASLFVPMFPTFKAKQDGSGIDWFNESLWLQGRRQGPVRISDSFPLVLPTDGVPKGSRPTSRPVRAMEEAKGARGDLAGDTTHTVVSNDPGETFPSAIYSTQLGERDSSFTTVGKEALKHDLRNASQTRTGLHKYGAQYRLSTALTGEGTHNLHDLFSRSKPSRLLVLDQPIVPARISSVAAPPIAFNSASTDYYPVPEMPYLNSSNTLVPSSLIYSILVQHPIYLSSFNLYHSRKRKGYLRSQSAHAVNTIIPREKKSSERIDKNGSVEVVVSYKKQSVGVLLGGGDGKSKVWGMGIGSSMNKTFVYAIKARADLQQLYILIVMEDHSSQLCPKCKWPVIYCINWNALYFSFTYRILECINCGTFWHRDKVGSMNLIDNLYSYSLLRKNIRRPQCSEGLKRGPRLSTGKPTEKLTRSWYNLKKKKGNDGRLDRDLFAEMIKKMEAEVVEKRTVQAEIAKANGGGIADEARFEEIDDEDEEEEEEKRA